MANQRIRNFAKILVDFSANIEEGDRVLVHGRTLAEELSQEIVQRVLERGGHPYTMLDPRNAKEVRLTNGSDEQLLHTNQLLEYAYTHFESRIKIYSQANTEEGSGADPRKAMLLGQGLSPILKVQFERGERKEFKWVTTMIPTQAYAQQAGMGFAAYEDFFYGAIHADDADPVAHWLGVKEKQQKYVDALDGHDQVELKGPNVDLQLSIKGRTWINSFGGHNMPSGEVFTGPVENSVNGWVRFNYPTMYQGRILEGVELHFEDGKVVKESAAKNEDFLKEMLASDEGARYVGEFAIGLNDEINRFTGFILLDEKIGGSFHMALGRGYPETGNKNESSIHWDMICDMREDAEIRVDGDVFYKNGKFTI